MAGEIHGCILTPRGFVDGTLSHLGGHIRRIEGTPIPDERARDEAHTFVLPGFIDSHVHGGGGRGPPEGGDAIQPHARLPVRDRRNSIPSTKITPPLALDVITHYPIAEYG